MISIIIYGRNDNYGYNLHKRAALSLNCMAEVLTEPSDEVIFVDYNTPDDYPTFPEAIQDTLTGRAKKLLRILRVRPSVHARFAERTHLVALEPIARNIAVRRSNPDNRWILSTNTDMIFVPHDGTSLSVGVKDLPRGLYHLPRFEIPETLWETFDRMDAKGTIDAVRHWGRVAHLNEIVLAQPYNRFDGPGDFQLIARDDLFSIDGFNEEMLLGWHVDSNIAKRVHLLYGKTDDLLNHLYGYHCDHTRQVTPMHRFDSVSNDFVQFADNVTESELEAQHDAWGYPHDEIEEIRLDETRNKLYLQGLSAVIPEPMTQPTVSSYDIESYDRVSYSPSHVLPFLADTFVNAPPDTIIGWIGADAEMFRLFSDLWRRMGFGGTLLLEAECAGWLGKSQIPGIKISDFETLAATAHAFVFDYALDGGKTGLTASTGQDRTPARKLLIVKLRFVAIVRIERDRISAGKAPRRILCVNATANSFEPTVTSFIGATRTPFSSRIRQGFVLPGDDDKQMDWTEKMLPGSAGLRIGSEIQAQKGKTGHVIYGPYVGLLPGLYRATVKIDFARLKTWIPAKWTLEAILEVVAASGHVVLAQRDLGKRELGAGSLMLEFSVTKETLIESDFAGIEIRIWSAGTSEFSIKSVMVEELSRN